MTTPDPTSHPGGAVASGAGGASSRGGAAPTGGAAASGAGGASSRGGVVIRRGVVLAGPAVALLTIVVGWALLGGRMPDPIATHWNAGGTPDGHTPLLWLTLPVTAVVVAAWALLLRQAATRRSRLRLTVAPWVWGTAVFIAGIHLTTLLANVDARNWRDAELSPLAIIVTLVAAGAAALAAHLLERVNPVAPVAAPRRPASVGLQAGERAVWNARVQSGWAAFGAVAIATALVLAATLAGPWWLAVLGPLVGLAGAAVSEIDATVDRRGLTIAYGPLAWPRQTVPLAQIESAESIEIDPWRVGGWGVRRVPRRNGATAIVIRAGEGIAVHRRDGRDLLVTLPDAAAAAGLLNDLARTLAR